MEGTIVKFLRQGIALAVVGAGLAAVPALNASAAPAPAKQDDKSLVQEMRNQADRNPAISTEDATGKVGFVRAPRGADLMPGNSASPAAKADAYLDKYAEAFGADSGQLVRDSVAKNNLGTSISYVQTYKDVPVFGTLVRAFVDKQGNLTRVNGEAVPDLKLSVTPKITEADAGKRAVTLVKAQPPTTDGKSDTTGVKAKTTELVVYRHGLVQGIEGDSELAYQVEVTNEKNVRDMVFLSANTGKIVNRYSMIDNALHRELYEADEDRNLTLVWEEGDPLLPDPEATVNADQDSMVKSTGEAYWFFKNGWGRDSFDGEGAPMYTINNDPAIQCPNANWNGVTTNYCDGVSSDDVVAHEWGHAYTEYTHGLIYQWQSGALNEGYSDIWGETVDLINNRLDEGEGDLSKKRTVGMCSTHSLANPLVTINSPASIAKDCLTGGYMGPVLDAPITSDVVIPTDAVEEGGTATDGCSTYDDAAAVAGKIVMVDRGLCTFVEKAEVARDAGAAALIIGNRDDSPISFSSPDTTLPPTASIGLTDREAIRAAVASGTPVNLTIKDASGTREDSFRWLIGEKSAAFGGAIRDMWNPTCYGDPGKVSDAEYKCSTDDNGGVHGNSGVVNHGYALLVDGGTYNDVAVKGIGLDKAAAIYYQAMTVYQTPVSNFTDHANSLEASCADLTNKAIKKLSTREDDSKVNYDKITADDCAQVAAMTQAVEFRLDPTEECGWQPLLAPNAPSACGEDFATDEVFSEDFESGMDNWTLSQESVFGGAPDPADWHTTSDYRGDHTSSVAMGNAPDQGDCSGTATDISSANFMTSGDIVVPADASAPRMTFEHYIATEVGYDGGNVRLSVNGGEFAPIAPEAFTFNAPGQLATAAEQSTNPLEGQPGFSGTDPGTPYGSWGESQVDLAAAGVAPGDTIQIQFAIGRDGCGGVDGWYVDNVKVLDCVEKVTATVKATPKPKKIKRNKASKVTVKVTAPDTAVTGKVTITKGKKVVGKATLADGTAVIKVKGKKLKIGKNNLVANYSGSDTIKAGKDKFVIRVVRR
ncbi:hypothetical protein ncot_10760 [Nocardioides sp. JQ2195]|uniref:M4 family metallopeptidase n=1 Tax=Nocardioides sp. JQ2195 TaxID=2592334 RepID=UPI00143E924A|nr:M4 family metallopeptidase [Nocardioides sp. JQ2195]QIX27020.1 hypothetical protein ncot_10760 [Nocardioides sp. JQ2195]